MNSGQANEPDEAPEGIDLVKRDFDLDVMRRGVDNPNARRPCPCGLYRYYSLKCGHPYKKVHLKCGRSTSKKTGNVVLCSAGRSRVVDVETARVPFNCADCRRRGTRWIGWTDADADPDRENSSRIVDDGPGIKQEDQDGPSSLTGEERERLDRGREAYLIPQVAKSSPSQLHSSLPFRGNGIARSIDPLH
ncbi:hypothetical protein F4805DRAFT_452128 [Annulohypoxylon moriforme]|nr:hypothetical protein F4805DRAFT_452128 [Annulohypoxylon moriforme]